MTVAELIEFLSGLDPNRVVIVSKDAEGNHYSPLSGCYTAAYRPDSTWSGEVGLEELTEDDKKYGYTEEDVISDGQPCVVITPLC